MVKMLRYNGRIIASKIIYCDNILQKGTGLMFRDKKSVDDTAWVFSFKKPGRIGVTMMFVFFPIDIIFLDEKNRIIELKENLRPFQNYTSKAKICKFIELQRGIIKKYSIRRGVIKIS